METQKILKWQLLDRKAKEHQGKSFFYERYVQRESKSGIVFYSTLKRVKGKKISIYVIEGYGIGTIDPKTFGEIGKMAPIQRYELRDYATAKKTLEALKEFNSRLAQGENFKKACKDYPILNR